MATTQTESEPPSEWSHVESQGPFHRVVIERNAFMCLPSALFNNTASEARDHCGTLRINPMLIIANERTFLSWLRLSIVLSVVGIGFFS
jgi:Domain of unknown function (DUF202)